MKKNVRKVVLSLASATFAFSAFGAALSVGTASAATNAIDSFKMVEGASIRTVQDSTGIRFMAEFSADLYDTVSADENKEFGMLVTKLNYYESALAANEDLIAGLNSLGENKYHLISESSANPLKPYAYGKGYRINGALTNLQYNHVDWEWIGVGVVITNGDTPTYEYAALEVEDVARSAVRVASAAHDDVEEEYSDTQKAILKNYVYEYTAKVAGLTKEEFTALEDKTDVLEGVTISVTGVDTSKKYNNAVEGKEAYFMLEETKAIDAVVSDKNGNVLDIVCSVTSQDEEVVTIKDGNATAVATGYTTLTAQSSFITATDVVTVYTGSESIVKLTETNLWGWGGASTNFHSLSKTGTIKGEEYYGYVGRTTNGTIEFRMYPDKMSAYFIDHMIEQGYKYVRTPFYFDTSLSHEFLEGVSEADKETEPKIRAQGTDASGTSGFNDAVLDCDEWIYWDMPIEMYRANFADVDGAKIDEYGLKTGVSNSWFYATALIMNLQNTCVYVGEQTFVKEGGFTVNETNLSRQFGDVVEFTAKEDVVLSVGGSSCASGNSVLGVFKSVDLTVNANIYTIDTSGSSPVATKSADVAKTVTVENGKAETVVVDVNGAEGAIAAEQYSYASEFQKLGFETSEQLVKRYSDGTPLTGATIANTERGIIYDNVTVTKNGVSYTYAITLDLYNSAEPIEYESFGHADSSYAVKAYYHYTGDGLKSYSYDKIKSTYTVAAGKGYEFTVGDGYLSLNKYGTLEKTDTANNASAMAAYGYTDGAALNNLYYVAIDQSKIDTGMNEGDNGPIKVDISSNKSGYAYIHVYVTPRHTKDYYAMFAETNTGVLKYACAAGWTSSAATIRGITGVGTTTAKQMWSAAWQKSISASCTVTLQNIVDNYEAFNTRSAPIFVSQDPQGYQTVLNGGVAKISSLLF